jgi:hypothetical protein
MLSWKKIACCCNSLLSYPSIILIPYVNHNPCMHYVFYWGRGFLTCVLFYEYPTSSQGAAVDKGTRCASNQQVGQRFSDTVFSPAARGIYWFLLTLTLLLQPWFLATCDTIKIFFCYYDFLDTCVTHVHFASNNNDDDEKSISCLGWLSACFQSLWSIVP